MLTDAYADVADRSIAVDRAARGDEPTLDDCTRTVDERAVAVEGERTGACVQRFGSAAHREEAVTLDRNVGRVAG
jgi:hypothetical protein